MQGHEAHSNQGDPYKECVAVLIEFYKKNVTVSCAGSDLLSEWALTPQNPEWW